MKSKCYILNKIVDPEIDCHACVNDFHITKARCNSLAHLFEAKDVINKWPKWKQEVAYSTSNNKGEY